VSGGRGVWWGRRKLRVASSAKGRTATLGRGCRRRGGGRVFGLGRRCRGRRPAGSSAVGGESVTTTGLSGNSIATSGASHSSKTRRSRSPVASCSNVLRAISRPLTSTTRRSSHALLIRPVTRLAGSPAGYFGQSSHGLPGASASEEARSYGAGAPLAIRSVFGVRSALSSVAVPQADAECRSAHAGHDRCRASPAITRRRLGCVGDPFTITDLTIVRQ
jgi:hypothetical protein